MKVSLNQKQIETAILMFINASGMAALPGKTTFDFTATRKKKGGEEGEVLCDVEVADPQITFTSQTPEVDINVVDDMPGADIDADDPVTASELIAASEAAQEESSEEQEEETSEQTEETTSETADNRPFANLKSAEEQEEESNESNEHNTDQASGNAASLFKR